MITVTQTPLFVGFLLMGHALGGKVQIFLTQHNFTVSAAHYGRAPQTHKLV